jgi:F420-dependent oxidoreductase-like protein
MRFGAFVPQGWRMDLVGLPIAEHWPTMLSIAKRIETAGYESLWVYDHFHTVPEPTQEVTYECFTLMAALAATTETVRLGQMCTCNSYRNPAYLAKVAANIDVISGGRLEFAIGAGWYEHEYLAYGYDFPKASVRIGMLREAVEIIDMMWLEDEATFNGKYYRVDGAINQPKPVQSPKPPLWIAGGGEKLTLRLAAEKADYTNFSQDVETFKKKSEILAAHCDDVGRDFAEIGRTVHLEVLTAETEAALDVAAQRAASQRGRDVESYRNSVVAGTPEQVVEQLQPFADAGCTYLIMYNADAVWGDSIELVAESVAPHFA